MCSNSFETLFKTLVFENRSSIACSFCNIKNKLWIYRLNTDTQTDADCTANPISSLWTHLLLFMENPWRSHKEYWWLRSVGFFPVSYSHLPSQVFLFSVSFLNSLIYFHSFFSCTLATCVPASLINGWDWVSEHNLSMGCIVGDWLWIRDKFESAGFGCVLFVLSFNGLVLAAVRGAEKNLQRPQCCQEFHYF